MLFSPWLDSVRNSARSARQQSRRHLARRRSKHSPQAIAEFLETRTFQVQEIARWIGIPPHLIGELSRSTNNNIEAQGIEFVSFAIGPWCIRWEQRIWLDCMGATERQTMYAKHRADAFLRGQTLSRYQAPGCETPP